MREETNFKELGIGVLLGVGVTLGAYFLKQRLHQKHNSDSEKLKKPRQQPRSFLSESQEAILDNQQLIRLEQYFGKDKLQKLRNSKVIVFGLGGVGSHVVNMLVRSGVQNLKIVDFDRVSLSSLSRHAYAVREDVGMPKTQCLKKYILKIFPKTNVETVEEYVTKDNIERLLQPCDYIIDCIDNIDAKVELSAACYQKNIRLIVSGGAGMKNDATQLQIRDISEARNDELISALRKKLYKLGIRKGITCVYSRQEASKQLLPLNEAQEKDPNQYRVFENYRVRIVPVLGTMPALIGQAIASYVLCQLCDQPYQPFEADDIRNTHYVKLYNRLVSDEGKAGVKPDDLQFDLEDVYILMRNIYKWKCIVTNADARQFYLTRWNPQKSATIYNLVPMRKEAYDKHIKAKSLSEMNYDEEICERYEEKCREIKKLKEKSGFEVIK